MARSVTAPDGVHWKVGRQWAPWRVDVRREKPDWGGDGGDGGWLGGLDDAAGLFVALGLLVAAALVFLVIWPVVALAIEAVIIAIGVLVSVAGKVILRRPWTIRAVAGGDQGTARFWQVTGWRASGELVDQVAGALAEGRSLPPGEA